MVAIGIIDPSVVPDDEVKGQCVCGCHIVVICKCTPLLIIIRWSLYFSVRTKKSSIYIYFFCIISCCVDGSANVVSIVAQIDCLAEQTPGISPNIPLYK